MMCRLSCVAQSGGAWGFLVQVQVRTKHGRCFGCRDDVKTHSGHQQDAPEQRAEPPPMSWYPASSALPVAAPPPHLPGHACSRSAAGSDWEPAGVPPSVVARARKRWDIAPTSVSATKTEEVMAHKNEGRTFTIKPEKRHHFTAKMATTCVFKFLNPKRAFRARPHMKKHYECDVRCLACER